MTIIGAVFLIFGLLCAVYISNKRLLRSQQLPFLFFIYHLGFALTYWWYSLSHPADSVRYYRLAIGPNQKFGFGSQFIEWLVQQLYMISKASYLDFFLIFHITGFLGLCLLYHLVLDVVLETASQRVKRVALILFLLPGMHFWTSSIGKDSVIFLGITLVLWALLHIKERFFAIFAGLLIIFLIRPHVAMILLAAIGFARLWSHGTPLHWRLLGSLLGVVVFTAALPFTMEYVNLESLDKGSITTYIQQRQSYNQMGGGGVDIGSYPFPLQVFTYLYRPLFFDAHSLFAVVVSSENLILLILSSMLLSRLFLRILRLHPRSFFIRTNFFFFLFGTCIFSLVTANLGIAIRQKTMLLPSLFILILLTLSIRDTVRTNKKLRPLKITSSFDRKY